MGQRPRESKQAEDDEDALPGIGLNGELSGSGSGQVLGPNISSGRASAVLFARHVEAAIINGQPPIDLGEVSGKVTLEQGVATLQDIKAEGSDGELEVNGEIQIAPDVTNSTMQLTVSLTPSAKGQATSGLLLNMLPHTPSDGPYHIRGALTSLSVS